jgi:hypothetical protein
MSTQQQFDPQCGQPSARSNRPNGQQFHPKLTLSTDGFETWWNKTYAQHTAAIAQADQLVRAIRRVSAVSDSPEAQTD